MAQKQAAVIAVSFLPTSGHIKTGCHHGFSFPRTSNLWRQDFAHLL